MNAFDFKISSPYGKRNIGGGFHHGIDYACPVGTPVLAPCDFEVLYSRKTTAAGYELIGKAFTDNACYFLHFIHLKELPNGEYREVKKGEQIAISGQSGTGAIGAHLHFEVNRSTNLGFGTANNYGSIDPNEFLCAIIKKSDTKGTEQKMILGKLTNKTTRLYDDGDGDIKRYYVIQVGEKTTVRAINEAQATNLAWVSDTPIKEHGSIDDFYQVLWALGGYNAVKNKDWDNRHELGHILFDYPTGNEIRF